MQQKSQNLTVKPDKFWEMYIIMQINYHIMIQDISTPCFVAMAVWWALVTIDVCSMPKILSFVKFHVNETACSILYLNSLSWHHVLQVIPYTNNPLHEYGLPQFINPFIRWLDFTNYWFSAILNKAALNIYMQTFSDGH
jgi:hypothetical protein